MKTLCCRLRKFTEHRSNSDIKQMSILLVGKDSSNSSTKEIILSTSKTKIVSEKCLLVFLILEPERAN